MKKYLSIILSTVIAITCLLTFAGCGNKDIPNNKSVQKAEIGIIETTGYKNKSYIHFYDSNLNFLYKEENNYASLSDSWDDAICHNNILFSIPKGTFEKQDEKCIVEYNIKTDKYEEYDMNLYSMNELAVSNNYIFGVNTINSISTISRKMIGQSEKVPLIKEFPDEYIFEMIVLDEDLYCFSSDSKDNSVHFKQLSIDDLSVIEDYDITEFGSPADMLKVGNDIYFTNQYTDADSGIPSNKITVYDSEKKSFSQIELSENNPNDILKYNNLLIISHFDRVQAIGNKITIYNLSDDRVERVINLNHDAVQCILKDNFLYVLSHDSISKYLITDNDLKEISTSKVNMQTGNTYFYLSSVFSCN